MCQEVLLSYPDFTKPFEIYTDASKYQLGAVIMQDKCPIAFYSRKLSASQLNYTTTERELLAIVETLKEFRTILLGQRITVYTDHKNLTYKVFNTERVMRWRLLCEEYSPTLVYLKGEHNVMADALSRLHLSPSTSSGCDDTVLDVPTTRALSEAFMVTEDEFFDEEYPLSFKLLQREQQRDKDLLRKATENEDYSFRTFRGGRKDRTLLCFKNKIVVPKSLQLKITEWYHRMLCHPGETRTELTISQHFTWKNLRKMVHKVCTTCHTCQTTKRTKKKYGHLPPKEAEGIPWETLCVDQIGPYKIKRKRKSTLELWCLTMIDPATGWFEIVNIPTKRADVIANLVEQTWLNRYPWPQIITLDRGSEFMAEFSQMVTEDYGVKKRPITKRNPQANAIIERVHQTIGNMIRTFSAQSNTGLDEEDPWSGILTAVAFAIRSTIHTTTQATPMQLVFGRDSILNISHRANWKYIIQRKQTLINKNNQRENSRRIPYQYQVGDLVLIKAAQSTKYGTDAYYGPHQVVQVNTNGTVRVREGKITDTYNIRMITPYHT